MNRIKELRKRNDMTLFQLAEMLGVSESTVQRYESGNIKNLKYDTMIKLANIFRCSPAFVMGWDSGGFLVGATLDADEAELILQMRKMNRTGRERLCEHATLLLKDERYNAELSAKKDETNSVS